MWSAAARGLAACPRSAMAAAVIGFGGGSASLLEEWKVPGFDSSSIPTPSYAGEVVVVTGGSTGIGKATCERFAGAGATVYNLDVVEPASTSSSTWCRCDVASVSDLEGTVNEIVEKEGRVDVLVSNAGVWTGGPMEDVTEAEYERLLSINVKGAFFAVKSVLPIMRQRKSGSIILIGSDQSLVGKPSQNLYGMTKGAVGQLAKSCAAQYAPEGVRVNVVCPGTIDTPLVDNAVALFAEKNDQPKAELYQWLETAQPYPRLGQPDEVAALITTVAKIPFVVGATISIDGGYTCQ